MKNLKDSLKIAAAEKNLAKRGIKIATIVAEALSSIGENPVLVGGAAVEFYTEGGYATKDIDMIAMGGPALWKVMEVLGFERHGKDFVHTKLKIYIEFPSDVLGEGEKSITIDVDGRALRIISIEDLIVDRLCAYKFWKSEADGVAALLLFEVERVDVARLKNRAEKEDVLDALDWIQQLYQDIVRKKLPKKKASQQLRTWLQGNSAGH